MKKKNVEYRLTKEDKSGRSVISGSLLESIALAYQRCAETNVRCREIADTVSKICGYNNRRYEPKILQEVGI